MQIQLLSDVHTESHGDYGSQWLQNLELDGTDVLIVAGDLASKHNLAAVLSRLCRVVPKVIFVDGNHEYYRQTAHDFRETMEAMLCLYDNLIWLWNQVVEIEGIRFLGTPLWFPDHPMNPMYESGIKDFRFIPNYRNWVYEENRRSVTFLKKNVRAGDIVITHHLPSDQCVHPQYKGSKLNRFFVTAMDNLILDRHPRYWFHGHTHSSNDFTIGSTRVVCNPHGYLDLDLNPDFNPHLTFEV